MLTAGEQVSGVPKIPLGLIYDGIEWSKIEAGSDELSLPPSFFEGIPTTQPWAQHPNEVVNQAVEALKTLDPGIDAQDLEAELTEGQPSLRQVVLAVSQKLLETLDPEADQSLSARLLFEMVLKATKSTPDSHWSEDGGGCPKVLLLGTGGGGQVEGLMPSLLQHLKEKSQREQVARGNSIQKGSREGEEVDYASEGWFIDQWRKRHPEVADYRDSAIANLIKDTSKAQCLLKEAAGKLGAEGVSSGDLYIKALELVSGQDYSSDPRRKEIKRAIEYGYVNPGEHEATDGSLLGGMVPSGFKDRGLAGALISELAHQTREQAYKGLEKDLGERVVLQFRDYNRYSGNDGFNESRRSKKAELFREVMDDDASLEQRAQLLCNWFCLEMAHYGVMVQGDQGLAGTITDHFEKRLKKLEAREIGLSEFVRLEDVFGDDSLVKSGNTTTHNYNTVQEEFHQVLTRAYPIRAAFEEQTSFEKAVKEFGGQGKDLLGKIKEELEAEEGGDLDEPQVLIETLNRLRVEANLELLAEAQEADIKEALKTGGEMPSVFDEDGFPEYILLSLFEATARRIGEEVLSRKKPELEVLGVEFGKIERKVKAAQPTSAEQREKLTRKEVLKALLENEGLTIVEAYAHFWVYDAACHGVDLDVEEVKDFYRQRISSLGHQEDVVSIFRPSGSVYNIPADLSAGPAKVLKNLERLEATAVLNGVLEELGYDLATEVANEVLQSGLEADLDLDEVDFEPVSDVEAWRQVLSVLKTEPDKLSNLVEQIRQRKDLIQEASLVSNDMVLKQVAQAVGLPNRRAEVQVQAAVLVDDLDLTRQLVPFFKALGLSCELVASKTLRVFSRTSRPNLVDMISEITGVQIPQKQRPLPEGLKPTDEEFSLGHKHNFVYIDGIVIAEPDGGHEQPSLITKEKENGEVFIINKNQGGMVCQPAAYGYLEGVPLAMIEERIQVGSVVRFSGHALRVVELSESGVKYEYLRDAKAEEYSRRFTINRLTRRASILGRISAFLGPVEGMSGNFLNITKQGVRVETKLVKSDSVDVRFRRPGEQDYQPMFEDGENKVKLDGDYELEVTIPNVSEPIRLKLTSKGDDTQVEWLNQSDFLTASE